MSKLREARQARGWSQTQLMHALAQQAAAEGLAVPGRDSLRIMVSRWENGHVQPDETYRRFLCAVYACYERELGLLTDAPGQQLWVAPFVVQPGELPERVSPELLAYLDRAFDEYARADNLLGARPLVRVVEQQAAFVDALALAAPSAERPAVLAVGARYAELCGWLHQDAGNLDAAQRWSDRALEYTHELGDPRQLSYVLMRKSNLATDAGQPARALGLAVAALRESEQLSPRLRAVALRQQALAHAMTGERAGCETALQQARAEVADVAHEPTDTAAAYCTSAYLASEAGACSLRLGVPQRAVQVLEHGVSRWPAELSRDRGLALSRLASAHLASRNIEQGCAVAAEAITAAKATRSARVLADLRPLRARLVPWQRQPEVAEVARALAALS